MKSPPSKFLCPLKANKYALQFLELKVKNSMTEEMLIDIQMEENQNEDLIINDEDYTEEMLKLFDEMRKKVYHFPKNFFQSKYMSTFLKFKVGDLEVSNMTIIENHYF